MSLHNTSTKLNRMAKTVRQMEQYIPSSLHKYGYTLLFNSMVKLAGTAGLQVQTMNLEACTVELKNKRRIQNHIGGLHACAMALAAESASGIVVGMNIPDTHLPLLKEMNIQYIRRCHGNITVTASLSDEQRTLLTTTDKGSIEVPVQVYDSSNNTPIITKMIWAWVPKKK